MKIFTIIFIIIFAILIVAYTISVIIFYIKLLFGYNRYKFTKIPSYGDLIVNYKWFKDDESAIEYGKHYDFIEDDINNIKIKP